VAKDNSMKIRKFHFVYLLMILLLTSCKHVFKEYEREAFPTYSWNDAQTVVFHPKIEDVNKSYQITIGLRHLYGLQLKSIPVSVTIKAPSGKEMKKDYTVALRDSENKNIGSCAGEMCDVESVFLDHYKFEEIGEHEVTIAHTESGYRIPGIMEVGLIIDEDIQADE
jgi:gliding motility-associated lipoprotein GldH